MGRPDVALVAVENRQRDREAGMTALSSVSVNCVTPRLTVRSGTARLSSRSMAGLALGELSGPAGEVWILCETLDQRF